MVLHQFVWLPLGKLVESHFAEAGLVDKVSLALGRLKFGLKSIPLKKHNFTGAGSCENCACGTQAVTIVTWNNETDLALPETRVAPSRSTGGCYSGFHQGCKPQRAPFAHTCTLPQSCTPKVLASFTLSSLLISSSCCTLQGISEAFPVLPRILPALFPQFRNYSLCYPLDAWKKQKRCKRRNKRK